MGKRRPKTKKKPERFILPATWVLGPCDDEMVAIHELILGQGDLSHWGAFDGERPTASNPVVNQPPNHRQACYIDCRPAEPERGQIVIQRKPMDQRTFLPNSLIGQYLSTAAELGTLLWSNWDVRHWIKGLWEKLDPGTIEFIAGKWILAVNQYHAAHQMPFGPLLGYVVLPEHVVFVAAESYSIPDAYRGLLRGVDRESFFRWRVSGCFPDIDPDDAVAQALSGEVSDGRISREVEVFRDVT